MNAGTTLQEINPGASACSVEWCPVSGLESFVACSTYLLEEPSASGDSNDKCGGIRPPINSVALGEGELCEEQEGVADGAVVAEEMVEASAALGQKRKGTVVLYRVSRARDCVHGHAVLLLFWDC